MPKNKVNAAFTFLAHCSSTPFLRQYGIVLTDVMKRTGAESAFLEKLIVSQLVKKFPGFERT
jgi:hypothetical protein